MEERLKNTPPRLGFIGTGLMGSAIVERLLKTGHKPVIWNREPEMLEPLKDMGARVGASPADVAASCDIVFLCVLDAKAVEEVVFCTNGVCESGGNDKVLVDHSTISPGETRRMAGMLREKTGMDWVDAPISGGPPFARDGRLTIMAGGSQTTFARVDPIMSEYGRNRTLMGPTGAGQMTKVINQAVCGVGYVMMAEILRLAELSGIDSARIPQCLAGGHADSTMLQVIYPRMAGRQFEPPASLARQMLKDLRGVLEEGQALAVELPLVSVAEERFDQFVAGGGGMAETASIYRLYNPNCEG